MGSEWVIRFKRVTVASECCIEESTVNLPLRKPRFECTGGTCGCSKWNSPLT